MAAGRPGPPTPPPPASTVSSVRVGVLTGGGDCPGLNAVIRAVVRKGETDYGDEIVGFLDAWDGVLERRTMPLDVRRCGGCCPRAARCSAPSGAAPSTSPTAPDRGAARPSAISASTAADRHRGRTAALDRGLPLCTTSSACPIVGVPKTIDNDIVGTEVTFGFHTAVADRHRRHRPAAHHGRSPTTV